MNQYETKALQQHFSQYKSLKNDIHLTKDMLDNFLTPPTMKMYELNLKARRQSKRFFSITDSDIKLIITQTYLNIIKQIEKGRKPVIANKIKEFFGMITYNQMLSEVKERNKFANEYVDCGDIEDLADETEETIKEKAEEQDKNHQLYLSVMKIAQQTLSKLELDCFTFKYYSGYTNKEIKQLLNISNINKVAHILHQAEGKLKEATKHL